jgi:hypothetical protein
LEDEGVGFIIGAPVLAAGSLAAGSLARFRAWKRGLGRTIATNDLGAN